ncbi:MULTISPECIES: tail fiber assembly protein [Citrobacter]|uniref:tail fiber assembly protein n=1 Tax=Citrobacter TaxID=544 RepID=UPI0015EAB321|nr:MULTISPECIES: tail fiber assembly protein [unclassified Citrobacter]MBA7876262.1 tail fiber assembly protein [Citrobacter sp. RHBSTW-00827]MBA7938695.1 tail fiber assembly protein [Citrobacter sp. RHBSTW-00509]QLS94746.1 tail fiber assembly protein [Citrobacter sp. RHBSTW-00859]QLT54129.1 tail fiber assembly protein [Citrobacter sp. RHBSTW-00821]QLU30411.1 tail fiber assembly protein [Citrobacter sp. RHBSTW-00446]
MTFEMTGENRTITLYNLRADTNEYIGKCDGFIPANTGLPAYSTNIAPPSAKAGFVAVFNVASEKWSLVEDHRGKIVYDIQTGKATTIDQLGKLPSDVVSVAPEGHFVKWDGKKWIHDAEAEKTAQITQATQQKESLLALASSKIAPLQDAVDLDIATEVETALLLAWKKYRVLLNRINPDDAPDISWPDMPA